ncbi:MAG TPA: hypothetical protein VIP09_02195 [Dehalococcoidia bacterium]|jgi:hypothetical protein
MIRYLSLAAGMASAANVALLAYPKDVIPQTVLIVVGVAAAVFAAGSTWAASQTQPVANLLASLRSSKR